MGDEAGCPRRILERNHAVGSNEAASRDSYMNTVDEASPIPTDMENPDSISDAEYVHCNVEY